jgi:PAS domain S-box-containing protein
VVHGILQKGAALTADSRPVSEYRWLSEEQVTALGDVQAALERLRQLESDVARLERAAARFRAIVDSATVTAIIATDPDGRIVTWNAGAQKILGWSEAEVGGLDGRLIFVPDDRNRGEPDAEMARVAAEGRAESERWHVRKDGSRFWGASILEPLKGEPGGGYLRVLQDRTAQHGAETARRQREEHLRTAIEAAGVSVWICDPATGEVLCMARGPDWARSGPTGRCSLADALSLVHGEDRKAVADALQRAIRAGEGMAVEARLVEPDGAMRWIHVRGSPIEGPAAMPRRLLGVTQDVTDRKRAEEREAVNVGKLNHRFKNTLVLIQATAWQTGLRAADVTGFLEAFDPRLRTIAAAHDLLSTSSGQAISLRAVVRAMLAEHDERLTRRIRVEVADLTLASTVVQHLALVMHELTTNALKHGALSVPSGAVTLDGRAAGGELVLTWRETGGPPAVAPAQPGFGITLLERVVARRYGGRAELDWSPGGLVCKLRLPLLQITG